MWIVLVQPNALTERAYAFDSRALALRFAEFVSEEIDPATVIPLMSPTSELLAWRDHVKGRDTFDEAVEQLINNGLMTELKQTAPATSPAEAITTEPNTAERTES